MSKKLDANSIYNITFAIKKLRLLSLAVLDIRVLLCFLGHRL